MEKTYFSEVQSFQWLGIIPGLVALLFGVFVFIQIVLKKPVGNHPAPNWLLVVIFLICVAGSVLMSMQKLKTAITSQGVYIDFGLFASKKFIPLTTIKSIRLRKYDGMSEFSGWGVKGNKEEQSYTVSGDAGIEIELNTGDKKILIGTNKASEVSTVLAQYLHQKAS